jgi:2-oxo-3-hexenedioate decarboxylase
VTAPADAAAALREARAGRRTRPPFTDAEPDLGAAWGLAVQDLDRAARVAAGERVIGAKHGLTRVPKQRTMGIDQPIVGFLTDAMADVDLASLAQPRVEPEIAFVLGRDLGRPLTRAEAGRWVDGVLLALEVLDSRYDGYRFRQADVLADNTSAAGVVLGDPFALSDDLPRLACTWTVDGHVEVVRPAAILGDPLLALVHLSAHLGDRGESLPAGAVVLCGAMTDAVRLPADVLLEAPGVSSVVPSWSAPSAPPPTRRR